MAQNPTRAEIEACVQTMELIDFDEVQYLDPNDDAHYVNGTYMYDYDLCRSLPIGGARLDNMVVGTFTACDYEPFTPSGSLKVTCRSNTL